MYYNYIDWNDITERFKLDIRLKNTIHKMKEKLPGFIHPFFLIIVQWNPSCEATPFAPEKWPFKRGGLSWWGSNQYLYV